jgi:hypothetical protein
MKREAIAFGEEKLLVGQGAEADLRPREVHEHGDRPVRSVGRGAYQLDGPSMLLRTSVRGVDSSHVHPGADELGDAVDRSGPDRADQLGTAPRQRVTVRHRLMLADAGLIRSAE